MERSQANLKNGITVIIYTGFAMMNYSNQYFINEESNESITTLKGDSIITRGE
jgi:hypothetical protein